MSENPGSASPGGDAEDTENADAGPPKPELEHVVDLDVEVAEPIEIGETGNGLRRIIPIVGGTVSGRIEGRVLQGGADYQLFRVDRPTELVAKYAIETDDGDRVYVENWGVRHASPENKERLRDGKPVPPEEIYMQSTPTFETASPDLQWLTEGVFVAPGIRAPKGVRLAVYRVG